MCSGTKHRLLREDKQKFVGPGFHTRTGENSSPGEALDSRLYDILNEDAQFDSNEGQKKENLFESLRSATGGK